jgi:restriction system protein
MAIHFSCPHCQSPLLVPEDSGGRTTKCPGCGDDFVIPGPATTGMATPVCAVLAPVEGKVSREDFDRARRAVERLTAENVALEIELARRAQRRRVLAGRARWLARFQAGRRALDDTVTRLGGLALCVTLGGAVLLILASLFSLPAFACFVAAVLGMAMAAGAYLPFSYVPDDARLTQWIPGLGERAVDAGKFYDQLAAEMAARRERLAGAEAEFERVKAAFFSRLHWLRTCQWQQMTGRNFVNFLKQVFEEHGYAVETTGKKGQAGIDLVVVRDGRCVAIQARAAPLGIVDSKVVDQTHAGKAMYGCDAAAVITGAQFMPSARQLADRLGCKLIDGSQIADLIEGRVLV